MQSRCIYDLEGRESKFYGKMPTHNTSRELQGLHHNPNAGSQKPTTKAGSNPWWIKVPQSSWCTIKEHEACQVDAYSDSNEWLFVRHSRTESQRVDVDIHSFGKEFRRNRASAELHGDSQVHAPWLGEVYDLFPSLPGDRIYLLDAQLVMKTWQSTLQH